MDNCKTNKCVSCGSDNLCSGTILTSGYKDYFKPDGTSFLKLSFGIPTKAVACLECGVTVLIVDPDEVRDFIREPRQKLQFSLIALIIIMTLLSVAMGLLAWLSK